MLLAPKYCPMFFVTKEEPLTVSYALVMYSSFNKCFFSNLNKVQQYCCYDFILIDKAILDNYYLT